MIIESLLCDEDWLITSPDDDSNTLENDGLNEQISDDVADASLREDQEEAFRVFLGKEARYKPEPGYIELLETNDLIRNARFKSVDWLVKSGSRMNVCMGTVFMAANYLDRFISLTPCQEWEYWKFELLSVACLSTASKFNETTTCQLHDFQVEGLENCFAPGLTQRMELRLLKTLDWRMDPPTPFSYIDFLIQGVDALNKSIVHDFTERVNELLLGALLDPKFLEFQQCVVAISAVRCAFEDSLPSTDDVSLAHLDDMVPQDHKDDLVKCQTIMGKLLVKDHNVLLACANSWPGPSSPVTVLKEEWFDFFDYQDDHTFMKILETNIGLGSVRRRKRKRKRQELESGL